MGRRQMCSGRAIASLGLALLTTTCAAIAGLDDFVDATDASGGAGGAAASGGQGQGAATGQGGSGATGGPAVKWARRFGGTFDEYQPGIAAGPDGRVAVVGFFEETVTFEKTLTSQGLRDIFVALLDPDGDPVWSKSFGDVNDQCMWLDSLQCTLQVAVDSKGDIVIAGRFEGSVNLGGATLTATSNSADILIAKLGSDGQHAWSKAFAAPNTQDVRAIAIDKDDNIILAGDFLATVDLGNGALTSAGERDILVAKFDAAGKALWSKRFGDSEHQFASSVAVDGAGNVVVAGHFAGMVDFGDGGFTTSEPVGSGNRDAYVAKLGPDGAHLWSKRYGDNKHQAAYAVAVAENGEVGVLGDFMGTIDFGKGALVPVGQRDMFLVKLQPNGSALWSKRFGEVGSPQPLALGITSAGLLAATGYFDGKVDFGGGPLEADEGSDDAFVAMFTGDGTHVLSQDMGDYSTERGSALAVLSAGDVIVAGEARGFLTIGKTKLEPIGARDIFVVRWSP